MNESEVSILSNGLELGLDPPWMNAPGSLGFQPPARGSFAYQNLCQAAGGAPCAFVTNPISLAPRTPAGERGLEGFEGGFLLHSGHPNPGLSAVLKRCSRAWAGSGVPVWVHLLADSPEEVQRMVRRLEGVEGVRAVELSFAPRTPAPVLLAMVQAASGELPVAVQIPLDGVNAEWVRELGKAGAAGIVLGPPRGALPRHTTGGQGGWMTGRLFGPALLPLVLNAVRTLRAAALPGGTASKLLPGTPAIIAGAGVFRRADGQALLAAGASAVQVDAALWRGWSD